MDIDIAFGKDVQTSQVAPDLKRYARRGRVDVKRPHFPLPSDLVRRSRLPNKYLEQKFGAGKMSLLSSLRRKC